ncbi:HD domain-containing protein [Desulfobaculum bizertense]|uniref:HD-GYP domain-containing protein n=1 Tax=Desulfobaculum bizertense TaxID=376490 RepID=UPI001F35F595|nr:HD domain-containing phosphohydrolase [Desulfobaculum bizertense]UIJ36931.1 HD domain-containing protein [Desulfobaculum bizertense]
MALLKSSIPNGLDEEYYQITPEILTSFPKFRLPLATYKLKEDTVQVLVFKKAGERISKEEQEILAGLCAKGDIFLARSDHAIYSKHISKQLDLVLQDEHLKEAEIAEIFQHAITDQLELFMLQPVAVVYEKLYSDLMVLTEYLWEDHNRIKALIRRLHPEHSLARHSFNSGILGLGLFYKVMNGEITRRLFDKVAVALFLHDMGMSKIPSFILKKTKPLTQDELQKVHSHAKIGSKMAHKLGLVYEEIQICTMQHHERIDGSGYPNKTRDIKKLGRVCAIADAYCAMTSKRVYADAKDPKEALAELKNHSDKFDGRIVSQLASAILLGDW